MRIIPGLCLVIVTATATEFGAWAMHRYVMHGWGWGWHRSHHRPRTGVFEKNDLYAVFFSGIALLLMLAGSAHRGAPFWMGIGVTIYGLLYFIMHDGLVHRRWPFRVTPRNAYVQRLVQAHHLHHAVQEQRGAVSFGFLYAPSMRRLRDQLRRNVAMRR